MKYGIDPSRINPEFLTHLTDPLGDVFEAVERDLLVNLARHFRGGQRVPKSAKPGSEAWRSYMLEQIGGLDDESIRIIAMYTGDMSELTQMAIRQSVEMAIEAVEPELAKAVRQPGYVPDVKESVLRISGNYAAQAINRENLVNTAMLNSTLRAYQKMVDDVSDQARKLATAQRTLNRETGAVVMGTKSGTEAVRSAIKSMVSDGLTGFTDARGREWSPEAYVQMDIRTTAANAAREAALDRNEAHGNNLISVSSHPGARPGCEPWQGRIYSTDGTSGTAHDQHGRAFSYIPLEGTSYGQPEGLFGINCGHFPSPFLDGISIMRAEKYDHEETQRLYQESQQQRYMERRIRRKKVEADTLAASGDAEGAKAARREARLMNADLQDWCAGKKRTYYPERTRIVRRNEGR